jgi:endonuclease/exonuclease/phosphatase (EEP) superfamily protein YafD
LPIESTEGDALTIADGIFSRLPIKSKRSVYINEPKGSGGYDDEYRAYVETEVDVEGIPLTVATSHMSYTHRFEETDNKKREADNLVKQLERHRKNFIFAGDLNVVPESYTIQAISKLLKNLGPAFTQNTWTTKPFSYNGFEENDVNWRLDYMFATSDVKVVSAEILKTDVSDHLPILARLAIT